MIARKLFPPEKRRANLDFGYGLDELEQIHAGQLPEPAAAVVRAKGKRLSRQSAKRSLIGGILLVALFGLLGTSAGARENDASLTLILLGVGFAFVIFVAGQTFIWFGYTRKANQHALRNLTDIAVTERGYKVTFGRTSSAPHWHFSNVDFKTIENGATYNIYYCADLLVYLEAAADA